MLAMSMGLSQRSSFTDSFGGNGTWNIISIKLIKQSIISIYAQ